VRAFGSGGLKKGAVKRESSSKSGDGALPPDFELIVEERQRKSKLKLCQPLTF
jgi:hypothetical protein